jgi:hypothetical protein
MLRPSFNLLSNPPYAVLVGLRALKKPTIATKNVTHTVLRGFIKF